MPEEESKPTREVAWVWSSPRLGFLATIVQADGGVREIRQFSPSVEAATGDLGRISADEADRILDLAAQALAEASTPAPEVTKPRESIALRFTDAGGEKSAQFPIREISQHAAVAALRKSIVATRRKLDGGFFSWTGVSIRVALVFFLLISFLAFLIVGGWLEAREFLREGQHLEAPIVARKGANGNDPNKSITVKIAEPGSTPADVKITDELSAENWDASKPGTTAHVIYLPKKKKALLEDDFQRNNKDPNTVLLLPLGLAVVGLVATVILLPYRSRVYPDGKEYMIDGDRVIADGRSVPFTDSDVHSVRLMLRLLRE